MPIIHPGNFSTAASAKCSAAATVPPPFRLGYRPWLDGLRGIAILLVLLFHFRFVPGGFLGVDIFFVLSGFLITCLLVEEWEAGGAISLKRFYLRRCLRLWPAFFTLLLASGLLTVFLGTQAEMAAYRREMLVAVCYLANWPSFHQTAMNTLGHTWSLSVEEQFYLLWPLLFVAMLRLGCCRRRILQFLCLGILACVLLRMGLYGLHRTPGPAKVANILQLYMGLHTRADTLLVGCLLGLLAAWNRLPQSRRFVFWSGVAALLSAAALGYLVLFRALDHSQFYHGLFTAVALMVAIILVRLLAGPARFVTPILESRLLVSLGRFSYALYLFHIPIMHWWKPAGLGWDYPLETLQVASLSLAAAAVSYYAIERPCLRLKHRFRTSAVAAPMPAAASVPSAAA